ncbi:AaceriAER392Wp [[Ashbya] aceris (nom. inval.)]|nr:AaceriAER392Wp [[Ashbya] aceris (nom. inval.)]
MVFGLNLSGTLNACKLLVNPRLCLPDIVVPTFADLPIPLGPNIKAVVLDKDNCFAYPHEDRVWPAYEATWQRLRVAYPGARLVIVSNTAGTGDDTDELQARALERNTGVAVLRHATKKPGCKTEVLSYLYEQQVVNSPEEVAVVGDRLLTDMVMARQMGAYGVWVRDGVRPSNSPIVAFEKRLYEYLRPDN